MSPEALAFVGAFAGGAAAGLVTAAARFLRLDAHLAKVAKQAAELTLKDHEHDCPWRAVAAGHVATELDPS